LANAVSKAFGKPQEDIRAVIIRNHGVVTVGNDIHKARAVVESLEEWAKIWTITKLFGGPKYVLDESKVHRKQIIKEKKELSFMPVCKDYENKDYRISDYSSFRLLSVS
jgi:L-fuculose-phosphate aldolase